MTAPANIVRACYVHDQGCEPGSWMEENVAPYMAWCEAKVNKWREACKEFGYDKPTHEIRTLTGSLTYHEWLKKEVGL